MRLSRTAKRTGFVITAWAVLAVAVVAYFDHAREDQRGGSFRELKKQLRDSAEEAPMSAVPDTAETELRAGCVYGLETFATAVRRELGAGAIDRLIRSPDRRRRVTGIQRVSDHALRASWEVQARGRAPTLPKRLGSVTAKLGVGESTVVDGTRYRIERTDGGYRVSDGGRVLFESRFCPRVPIDPEQTACKEGAGYAEFTIPAE